MRPASSAWPVYRARNADEGYPANEYLRIEKGEVMLKRLRRTPDPAGERQFKRLLKDRMTPVGILEVLIDTEHWLGWTQHYGPISGHDPKLDNPRDRYIVTTFCYGFDFGPTQTCRSIRGLDRRQVAFVNQRHVTEEKLNEAITTVVNGYAEIVRLPCRLFHAAAPSRGASAHSNLRPSWSRRRRRAQTCSP